MLVTLFFQDKIFDFKLPHVVSGSFSFDADEEEKLVNIEARNGGWFLYGISDVKILTLGGTTSDHDVCLQPYQFYVIQRSNQNYLLYVSELNFGRMNVFSYDGTQKILFSSTSDSLFQYSCPYLKDAVIQFSCQENMVKIESDKAVPVYRNKRLLSKNTFEFGDEITIFGLRIVFLKDYLFIHDAPGFLTVHIEKGGLVPYAFSQTGELNRSEIKDVDLYKKSDYFTKSPRIRRLIETKTFKLSAPPKKATSQELPIILVVGPMMTMGISASAMLINVILKIQSGETTFGQSWPQLFTSGAMLVSMIVWPFITQAYNRRMKKKQREELINKYSIYLNEKRGELEQEYKLQKMILAENLLTVDECLNIIQTRGINFWDKRIDQNDFLQVRLGIGMEKLDIQVEYPEEGFTVEEDELRKKADALVEEYRYMEMVPLGYSFYNHRLTAVMGMDNKSVDFVHNILLQLITFYSYEDLKIVAIIDDKYESDFQYLRYLNHVFTNDRTFRFFAINSDSAKVVADYLYVELGNRINQISDSKEVLFKPHYFIITNHYDWIKRHDFVKTVTEIDENLGFSFVILENQLGKLPSKCNNFIMLGDRKSSILRNSFENQEVTNFSDEIHHDLPMMEIAQRLSNIPIEFEEGVSHLPDALTFLEMEKVGKVEQLNILNRWNINDSTSSLRAEVGVDSMGDLMYLDLHEKFHGPHGLIAGMTGSGKSEFIITYILSMAINYSPDDVSFILIDYKGGGLAFAFENKAANMVLPHLAGTITNLDKAEMDRTLVSIDSEIKRRQRIFNDARNLLGESTIDIYKYQKYYKEGRLQEAVPHLFIICDEFAELKSQQPDFMDNLISVARIGRSLGVHLILATQKPSGVVNDQIWSNTKFRVCLKVQDEADSKEMLKRPEAASLKQVGRFYLQVGYDEYFALGQSGWCGAKYYPSEKIVKQVNKSIDFINDYGGFVKSIQASSGPRQDAQGEQLAAILKAVIDVSLQLGKKARRLWLENIPNLILENDLQAKYQLSSQPYCVSAILGEYDAPEEQKQGLVQYDYLQNGNTIIYGMDGSERENLLSTLLYSTCKNHSANEVNFYILDYGSESLRRYSGLPQVGGMVFSGEDEKYYNLLKLLREELQQRKKLFIDYGGEYTNYIKNSNQKLPLCVVIINNYDSLYDEHAEVYEELPDLVRDSERYGVIYLFAVNSVNSLQAKIAQNCSNLYAFRMKEDSDYASIFGARGKLLLRDSFGRGLIKHEVVHEFQTASIASSDEELNSMLLSFVEQQKQNTSTWAKKIPVLPDIVRLENIVYDVPNLSKIPVGIAKKDLELCTVDYTSNLFNCIAANKLKNTENFVLGFLEVLRCISNLNIIVFDEQHLLQLNPQDYPNYYFQNVESILDQILTYLENLKGAKTQHGIIIIYGLNKFISKLTDVSKMQKLVNIVKQQETFPLVVIDDASKIKGYAFESWFTNTFSLNDGIWIGRGLADQSLFKLSSVTKEMTQNYKNDMGYVITENMGVLCKFIQGIDKENVDGK